MIEEENKSNEIDILSTKTEINNNLLNKTNEEDLSPLIINDDNIVVANLETDQDEIISTLNKEPLIKSIAFGGLQAIQGTDNYKFQIKVIFNIII